MKFVQIVKGKLFVTMLAGVVLIGGATAAFAATPAGQGIIHAGAHRQPAATAPGKASHKDKDHSHATTATGHGNSCPGFPQAQQLASEFLLSAASTGDAVLAICALHQGTFKGTTTGGTSVSSSRVFGYGEIEMLLTYTQSLASHDKANTSGTLTSNNARNYLAQALQNCGATPLETCLKSNIPGFQPGSSTGTTNGQHSDHGHGNSNGKPTSTPTPHH
ncbi:MAG: hypothetical protein ACRDIV_21045 [Ktedonobacteraceae bacterium]